MWNGKMKALTFSYDDGVTQDKRLIEIFDKYGLKATFNINSALLGTDSYLIRDGVRVDHIKVPKNEVKSIYRNHEVSAHTLHHPFLPDIKDDDEIIKEIENDRAELSRLVGYDVVGLAYPCGGQNTNERVEDIVKKHTGVKYARTIIDSDSLDLQSDLIHFNPTVYHREFEKMERFADEFINLQPEKPQLYYIWGHSYEFDINDSWDKFERFCEKISGRDDIYYCTNKEAFCL